jgi:hypothetical protein
MNGMRAAARIGALAVSGLLGVASGVAVTGKNVDQTDTIAPGSSVSSGLSCAGSNAEVSRALSAVAPSGSVA